VHGLPVRLRLIVAAPLGYEAGDILLDEVEALLNYLVPGLSQMLEADRPRIRTWPTQFSSQGFVAAFLRHTLTPDPERQLSRWVLVIGKALMEHRPVAVGLVLLADQENLLGRITLEHPHQWLEALRIRT
jgi:hypothetical protein